ncbi:MAG: DUF2207 domain-containing protein [Clostridia bacterium]|nr:DUF2207 domain-containing protein [Clostridia bacterium]
MLYYFFAGGVYACILAILLLALIYGRRARRNVKREKITCLSAGFSPLDVQRIFIGKTYPRRLTRALIVHWAQMGYISVEQLDRNRVKLFKLKHMPKHRSEDAVFFDRGTYVREWKLFDKLFSYTHVQIVKLNKPLFSRDDVKEINGSFAVREDEGVYSQKHYTLKVITFALSVIPFFLSGIYLFAAYKDFSGIAFPLIMLLGMFVFRFMLEIPFWFRLIWSMGWVASSIAILITEYVRLSVNDFLGMAFAAIAILFLGTFVLVRFVDYREKNNLDDYSDLINYKKFLLFSSKEKLTKTDYYAALPYIYAFGIKPFVKRKFNRQTLPDWYKSADGKGGGLL